MVTRQPSFYFPAVLSGGCDCHLSFTVEFQDAGRTPLSCSVVTPGCDAGCDCWPKSIRSQVAFPQGARWWEGNRKLYEEAIRSGNWDDQYDGTIDFVVIGE